MPKSVSRFGPVLLLVAGLLTAPAMAQSRGYTTGEWLTDLARDHGLSLSGAPTAADLQLAEALLAAAVRADDDCPAAHRGLYELAQFRGDDAAAAEALRAWVRCEPDHAGAVMAWLELELSEHQTAEDRERWLRLMVGDTQRSDFARGLGAVYLARIAHERREDEQCAAWLGRAREFVPDLPEAALAEFHWTAADATPAERLRVALQLLEIDPLKFDAAWAAGRVLDELGRYDQAAELYAYAQELQQLLAAGNMLAADRLLDLAYNQIARQRYEDAVQSARQAIVADPSRSEAAFLLLWLYEREGSQSSVIELTEALRERFAEVRDPNAWPVNTVAQAAWFYAVFDPETNQHRALALAEAAAERAPRDPYVQRVLGWALALDMQTDAAGRTLRPLAAEDPYAAYRLATLLRDQGEEQAAADVVAPFADQRLIGPAAALLAEVGYESPQPTTAPADEEIERILSGFNTQALQFIRGPEQFLDVTVSMDKPSLKPGEPWWAELRLHNRSTVPLSIGTEWLVNPVLVLSFTIEGDRTRQFPNLLTVTFDQVRILAPGESATLRRRLDLGPLRRATRAAPQQLQRLTLRILVDPIRTADGAWQAGPLGRRIDPVYFNRVPASVDGATLAALRSAIGGQDRHARRRAVDVVAQLLGEAQRAALGRLNYRPEPVSRDWLRETLLGALGSSDAELRAHALVATDAIGFTQDLLQAVRRELQADHWLVRMMAVRVLARLGPDFAEDAARIATEDEDPQVRTIAASYVTRWKMEADRAEETPPPADETPGNP